MTYLQTSRRPSQIRNRALLIVALIVFLIFGLIYYIWPNFIPGTITALARPFWRLEFAANGGAFRSQIILMNEIEELKRQLLEGEVRLASVSMLEAENLELKNLLGRPIDHATSTKGSSVKVNKKLAAVLERPPFIAYDELIIDQGLDAGFVIGDKVYAPGNILIGEIDTVFSKTSKVILFSSPQKQYQVLIGHGRVPATAFGRGGGQYEAQVARDIKISEGDFVDAPSISDRSFGIVSTVISDPTQPFETIIFAPPVNIYQLRWVLVDR